MMIHTQMRIHLQNALPFLNFSENNPGGLATKGKFASLPLVYSILKFDTTPAYNRFPGKSSSLAHKVSRVSSQGLTA
jgi:hypothetical protein